MHTTTAHFFTLAVTSFPRGALTRGEWGYHGLCIIGFYNGSSWKLSSKLPLLPRKLPPLPRKLPPLSWKR